jgi:hypothetical protein
MSALATAVAPSALDAYRREPLLVCALWQPWATLAAIADPETGEPPKAHETRHWAPRQATPFRVVIHATKTWNADCRAAVELEVFRSALKRIGFYPGDPRPFERRQITPPSGLQLLPLGALIAVATVLREHRHPVDRRDVEPRRRLRAGLARLRALLREGAARHAAPRVARREAGGAAVRRPVRDGAAEAGAARRSRSGGGSRGASS